MAGKVDAVVTCPANKEAMQAAGVAHPGHTEIFAERTKTETFCMAFISDTISCSLEQVVQDQADDPLGKRAILSRISRRDPETSFNASIPSRNTHR